MIPNCSRCWSCSSGRFRLLLFFALAVRVGSDRAVGQDVRITEFLAVNDGGILDEDREPSDWIELTHSGKVAVDLAGWFLTDDPDSLRKWEFPARTLEPGSSLVVFASGKNRIASGLNLHTSFRLSSGGEFLALVLPDGATIVDSYAPRYPPQAADISYGIVPAAIEGEVEERYFPAPTPGAENVGTAVLGFVADTKFSRDRGFYETPFDVAIRTATPDATIRYTVDGSSPTRASGRIYAGPIPVATTTIVRAAAFKEGYLETDVDTHTYVFPVDVVRQTGDGFPSMWENTQADYEMDPDVIDDPAYSETAERDIVTTIPTLSLVMDNVDLFGPQGIYSNTAGRGVEWERPCSMELIYPDDWRGGEDQKHEQLDCGIRIFGFGSRPHGATLKHSFRLLFKRIYGPGKLRAELFPDFDVEAVDELVLRAQGSRGWNDSSAGIQQTQYIRDAWSRYTARDMGKLTTSSTYVNLYLNGLYWGLYNPVERPDAQFLVNHLGGNDEDYDALNGRVGTIEVLDGSRERWDDLLALVRAAPRTFAEYEAIAAFLDVSDLIDYMLLNFYTGNRDWTGANGNNMRVVGAPRNDVSADAGGYRSFCWDMEYSIWGAADDVLAINTEYDTPATIHSFLRSTAEYRLLFADRVQKHFHHDGALTPENTAQRWRDRAEEIHGAIVGESARWGDRRRANPFTRDVEWLREKSRLLTEYFPRRGEILLEQLRAARLFPDLQAPEFQRHGGPIEPGFLVSMKAPTGVLYYTTDGTDPRLPGGELSPTAVEFGTGDRTTLLPERSLVRALVPTDDGLALGWTAVDFDDGAWVEGETGVGFERSSGYEGLISTDVGATMFELNSSVYLRMPFDVDDPTADFLVLRMKYDDGFVAYLNGRRVAASHAPDTLAWDSAATASTSDELAVEFEDFDLSGETGLLKAGRNVLAIHGMNRSPTNGDLLILPQLEAAAPPAAGDPRLLHQTTIVRARAFQEGNWSPLTEAIFFVPGLRISELYYHPEDLPEGSAEDLEFIELVNVGDLTLPLAGMRLAGGVRFSFADGTVEEVAPGEVLLLVKDTEAFTGFYGASLPVAGEYAGNLSNRGEEILLEGAFGERVLAFTFDDSWYPSTDGDGASLEIRDAGGDPAFWGDPNAWAPRATPTPGVHNDEASGDGLQRPSDANQDSRVNLVDAVSLARILFVGDGPALPCGTGALAEPGNRELLDADANGSVDVTDTIYLLDYLFRRGPPPVLGTDCVPLSTCPDACGP